MRQAADRGVGLRLSRRSRAVDDAALDHGAGVQRAKHDVTCDIIYENVARDGTPVTLDRA